MVDPASSDCGRGAFSDGKTNQALGGIFPLTLLGTVTKFEANVAGADEGS